MNKGPQKHSNWIINCSLNKNQRKNGRIHPKKPEGNAQNRGDEIRIGTEGNTCFLYFLSFFTEPPGAPRFFDTKY